MVRAGREHLCLIEKALCKLSHEFKARLDAKQAAQV
jgi:hypothetical protein